MEALEATGWHAHDLPPFCFVEVSLTHSLGTLFSVRWDTALPTSQIHNVHNSIVERTAYFARKRNLINVIFVKRAWAWTSLLYLFHLLTTPRRADISTPSTDHVPGRVNPALHVYTPHSRGSRAQRLATLVLASLAWIAFTSWCFGAGIGDRIIAASGGVCSVPLPKGIETAHINPLITPAADPNNAALAAQLVANAHLRDDNTLYLPLPAKYCLHVPLNPKTHPLLFQVLEATHDIHKDIHAALRLPPPRWSGGFDISGHAFLLTLGALILAAEVAPSWRAYRARGYTQRVGKSARLHAIATVLATALIALWIWMLLMTAIYFHDVDEKLAGLGRCTVSQSVLTLVLGLVTAAIVHTVVPRQATGPVIEFKVRGPTRRPSPSPMHHAEPVHPFDAKEVDKDRLVAN